MTSQPDDAILSLEGLAPLQEFECEAIHAAAKPVKVELSSRKLEQEATFFRLMEAIEKLPADDQVSALEKIVQENPELKLQLELIQALMSRLQSARAATCNVNFTTGSVHEVESVKEVEKP